MATDWLTGELVPPLEDKSVQVWRLLPEEPLLRALEPLLNADERARAERTRAGSPQNEFIAARGALRLLLGELLGRDPRLLKFEISDYGKPSLAGEELQFNVSHSSGCILIALSRAGAVGVDVEPMDRQSMGAEEALELARENLHPDEIALITSESSEAARLAIFFRCWTRKEAVVKADGRGMQISLASYCVLETGETVEIELPGDHRLWVQNLPMQQGFSGALALPEREWRVSLLDFTLKLARKLIASRCNETL